ncbi:hypothetical protein AGABI1DRAFT_70096 [Agaricus bisporus var. burnettii JB137-S8]|uniref:F-box domain-containing protein n=1 Tax=Agaricus bisporus var. burnettii (strain JB137-S8 / ATCC MYA-4627 / FGSC 10392) TaxID=597362 RepID=K5XEU2_AGABU|nr:uncharacterized protein AGABI1DRAFT_70096 [Agaricus bisporus var. burnettii JB137-S8]EKM81707.1 hypothetical protein AGABI1DRAFT_70096 [Agaricus bisporus var. burnettii JB137-S8]
MANGKAKATELSPEEESPELARFREEWKAELERRKQATRTSLQTPSSSSTTRPTEVPHIFPARSTKETHGSSTPFDGQHPAITPDGEILDQKRPKALSSALGVYRQAVLHEQAGDLDSALMCYRQAFRTDPHVDRAYRREEMLKNMVYEQQVVKKDPSTPSTTTTASTNSVMTRSPGGISEMADEITETMRLLSIKSQTQAIVTGTFGALVASFLDREPGRLAFKPEDETQPVIFNDLPEEILVEIIHLLDPTSIERFAQVSKKARIVTLESSIWRSLVVSTYKEPQIPDLDVLAEIVSRYMFDYRRIYIEQPRVRLDGVYIAICHYVRPGLSENHWVNMNHLITYHRYLRFYPNGQVLSLLANEEHPPQTIINILKPSLRMKGLCIGIWELTGTTVTLSNLSDASGRFIIPEELGTETESGTSTSKGIEMPPPPSTTTHPTSQHRPSHHLHSQTELQPSRYVFSMSLSLRSRPLGRWNRLDIQSYDTLNIETGDVTPVALKHERSFWFSRVRSYT